ncbi:MAG: Cell wall-associated polypeptide, partial [Pseudomonadota bacterium]
PATRREALSEFGKGAATSLALGAGVAYGIGFAFGISNPVGWLVLGGLALGGGYALWRSRQELVRGLVRLQTGQGTPSDYNGLGTAVGSVASGSFFGRLVPAGFAHGAGLRPGVMTAVSRWGAPGLRPGAWVMEGERTVPNYVLSFKWERSPWNESATFSTGETFLVPRSTLAWPRGWGRDGWIKGLFNQRLYSPPGSPPVPPPMAGP